MVNQKLSKIKTIREIDSAAAGSLRRLVVYRCQKGT